jgi:hypothetical protein
MADDESLSLVQDDAPARIQRALKLMPARGLGVWRRAAILAAVTWVPVAAWAAWRGRALAGQLDEPLLQHFGVTIRCLLAIPLLIIAEASVDRVGARFLERLEQAGIAERARVDALIDQWRRLKGRTTPWIGIVGLVIAWSVLGTLTYQSHELKWAVEEPLTQRRGFGGWWYLLVSRPIYLALVLAWIWRVALLTLLMFRVSRSGLSLIPTHPDGLGGLGFARTLPAAFALVGLALSSVLSSGWAHNVVYHEVPVLSLRLTAAVFLVAVTLLFLGPVLVFTPLLVATKAKALEEYGDLLARHGRGVRARWIEGRVVEDGLLAAPEMGAVADTIAMYDAVKKMRVVPVGIGTMTAILIPAMIPMFVVVALQVPVSQILRQVLGVAKALI